MSAANQPDGVLVKSDNVKGMVWMLIAGAIFSINFSIIRTLGQDLNVFEIVFFRNLFGFAVFIPWLIRASKEELIPSRPWLVGLLNDGFQAEYGDAGIRQSLVWVQAVCLTLAGVCYLIVARTLDRDMDGAET